MWSYSHNCLSAVFILSPSVRASCYTIVYRVPYWPNREHLVGCDVIVTRSTVSMSVGTPLPPFMLQWRASLVFASQFSLCFSAQQACLCWYFTSQQSHCSAVISETSSAIIIFSKSSTIIMSGFGIDRTDLFSSRGQQLEEVTRWQLLWNWQNFKSCWSHINM